MTKRSLFIALSVLSAVALVIHLRAHNFMMPDKLDPSILHFDRTKFLSFLFSLIDVVFVTVLFTSRRTARYGYLLNGLLVIYGTVFMAHYSIAEFALRPVAFGDWILRSELAVIGIAWVDFIIGKSLYELYMKTS